MKVRFQKSILSSKRLREEVFIAFGLIIMATLVLLGYLFPGAASFFESKALLPAILGIIFFILIIGFMIVLQIVEPVVKMSREAKMISDGDWSREIQVPRNDELGDLGVALNDMTSRIRKNVIELQELSQTASQLNEELNRRISSFSHMMEMSHHIAHSVNLDEILTLGLNKCLQSESVTLACALMREGQSQDFSLRHIAGKNANSLINKGIKNIKVKLGEGLLGKAVLKQDAVVIDVNTPLEKEFDEFSKMFLLKNVMIAPIICKGNNYGLFIAGNERNDFSFSDQDKELLRFASKQMGIAVLNDLLTRELQKLEATDGLTGLLNNVFTRRKLSAEIKEAVNFQRTCSFVLFRVDNFLKFYSSFGHIEAEYALIKIASLLKEGRTEGESTARFADHEFALILPAKPKRDAIRTAEDIVRRIDQVYAKETDPRRKLTVSAAVAENPIDGATADELILKSGVVLTDVVAQGGNRVGH